MMNKLVKQNVGLSSALVHYRNNISQMDVLLFADQSSGPGSRAERI